jgi:ribosomal protein S24E
MEIKNINEQENPLFKRKEAEILVDAEITPSHEQVLELLSNKYSTKPEAIKIKAIYGSFGSKEFRILANIYASQQDKEAVERKSKKEAELEKKKSEPEKPVEAPAENKPLEKVSKPEEEKPAETPAEKPAEEKISDQPTTPEKIPDTNNKENSEPSGETKESEPKQ